MGFKNLAMALRRAWAGDPAVPPNARIGTGAYVGPGVMLDWAFGHLITIEDEATVVNGTRILCHDASSNRRLGATWCAPVRVCARAYVGADALLLPGVTVGQDAVVAAGAVVTEDVASGTIVAGVPARAIGEVADLDARRRALMETRPVFGPEHAGAHLTPELVSELAAAGEQGGYFLRSGSSAAKSEARGTSSS